MTTPERELPAATPPAAPWRDGTVTAATCPHCAAALPTSHARVYCSNRCRQAAYRRRANPIRIPPPPAPAGRTRTEIGVYECPHCTERLLGERRCPDCNIFTRRLGDGGCCTSCGDIITTDELLNPE